MGFFDKAFNVVGDVATVQMDMATGGGFSNAKGVQNANDQNQANAQAQMNFQERMSNTGYQRATADMRAAGLNPALAYENGPASSPSGASATSQPVPKGGIGGGLASQAKSLIALDADTKQTNSQTSLNKVSQENVEQTRKLNTARTTEAQATAKQAQIDAEVMEAEKPSRKALAPYMPSVRAAGEALGVVNSGLNVFKSRSRAPAPEIPGQISSPNWRGGKPTQGADKGANKYYKENE